MKRFFVIRIILLFVFTVYAQDGLTAISELSQADIKELEKAIRLVDEGLYDAALMDFDQLVAEYPDNYIVLYERLYLLSKQKNYKEIKKSYKKVLKHKDVTDIAYHLVCMNMEDMGKHKEAVKIVRQGLEKFPESGLLYMVQGVLDEQDNDYGKALSSFNKGITKDPMFWKNYMLASEILLQIPGGKVWSLIYNETAMLLSKGQQPYHNKLASTIRNTYVNSIKVDPDTIITKFTASRDIIISESNYDLVYLGFPGVYEGCVNISLQQMNAEGNLNFKGNIDQLAEMRKGMVKAYYERADGLYGDAMYLFPFQKAVIDAGYWEAYHYFLFGYLFKDEYINWLDKDDNERKLNEFFAWYTDGKFILDKDHSVCEQKIFSDCKPISLIRAFAIQASLLKADNNYASEFTKEQLKQLIDSDTMFNLR